MILPNSIAAPALNRQCVKITAEDSRIGDLTSIPVGEIVTVVSSGAQGIVMSVDTKGNSMMVRPINSTTADFYFYGLKKGVFLPGEEIQVY